MDNIQIEKLDLDEVDLIKDIENNQGIDIISKNNIINDIGNNQTLYHTLKFDNKIIGYIAFDIVLENMNIQSIVIDKNYQRKGYGTAPSDTFAEKTWLLKLQ